MKEGKNQLSIQIIQMDKHFLYLPLYYAQYHHFFDYIPIEYKIEPPILAPTPRTDKITFQELMQKEEIHFAICDPIQILNADDFYRKPAVLASIVTNSAFWAVDRKTHSVNSFIDIGLYEQVIAYAPGSTSYGIAKRLHTLTKKELPENEFIKVVQTNREIEELQISSLNTIALSPNPFDIDDLRKKSEGGYKINIALGDTPEYHSVLVTALISYPEFVEQHPSLVNGLLKALHRAILLIRCYYESDELRNPVMPFIKDYFGKNAPGALKMALDSHVFPENILIQKVEWENSVRANNPDKSEIENEKIAKDSFDKYIKPYIHIAKKASVDNYILHLLPPVPIKDVFTSRNILKFLLVALASLLIGWAFQSYFISLSICLIFLFWIIVLIRFRIQEQKILKDFHNIICIIAVLWSIFLIKIDWIFPEKDDRLFPVLLAASIALIGWEINTIQKAHKHE